VAKDNIREYEFDLIGGKSGKDSFGFVDSAAQMNGKIERLQLLNNRELAERRGIE
jgi:hypothetical protein